MCLAARPGIGMRRAKFSIRRGRRSQGGPIMQISGSVIQFRSFQMCTTARQLLLDHKEVEIGSRAFDLLAVLLEARGQVVDKSQIIQKVWPFTFVEECNLRFQMGVLRKALGRHRDLIKTIPGRGYMLADDLPEQAPMEMAPPAAETKERMTGSPSVDEPLRQTGSGQPPSPLQKIELLERENLRLRRAIAELAAVHDVWPHAQA